MRMLRCPGDYCLRNGCSISDLAKLPSPMFRCGECDINYSRHNDVKKHMDEKHSYCDEDTEQKQDYLIETRHDEKKMPPRRFDKLPFDPVTRNDEDGMLWCESQNNSI